MMNFQHVNLSTQVKYAPYIAASVAASYD